MPPKRVPLEQRAAQEAPKAQATDRGAPAAPSALWAEEAARQEVVTLDVTQIMPNPRQPRTLFDQAKLEELAHSIHAHGVIQPVTVRPIPLTKWDGHARRYELIAGERRWRASMLAGRATIPALVRQDANDHETLIEVALIENLQRADLHPLEEALAFGTMRDQLGYSIRRIGERVSRSKGYVENRLKLLDLDSELQQLVSERPDTLMHVGELVKLADPVVRAELIDAVRNGLSYTETQARVRHILAPPAAAPTPDVSLRPDGDRRDQDGDHGERASADVSLRKDSDRRDQNGDHGDATSPQATEPRVTANGATTPREAYPRQQDGDHDASRTTKEAARAHASVGSTPTTSGHDRDPDHGDLPMTLSTGERTALLELARKLELWLDHPEQLTAEDWKLLAPVAQRLGELSRRFEQ